MKDRLSLPWLGIILLISLLLTGCQQKEAKTLTPEDFPHSKIGVLLGSSLDEYATKTYPEAEIIRVGTPTDLSTALKSGSCDVMFLPETHAEPLLENDTKIGIGGILPFISRFAVAFQKGDNELLPAFNAFLASIKADGSLEQLIKKWKSPHSDTLRVPEFHNEWPTEPIRVGCTGIITPYSFFANNELQGLDTELMLRFGAYIGRPIEFVCMNFEALIPALKAKDIDIVASCLMITEERSKAVSFSNAYIEDAALYIVKQNPENIRTVYRSIDDLSHKTVATITGYVYEKTLREKYPNMNMLLMDAEVDLIQSLKGEKCDAIVLDGHVLQYYTRDLTDITSLTTLYSMPMGVTFSKECDINLLNDFNRFLKKIKEDGTYDDMYRRWIEEMDQNHPMPHIELPTEGEPLRIATNCTSPPLTFIQNGEMTGFDIEMGNRFAQYLQRPVLWSNMSFSGLIPSLVSGKNDMGISGINISEERAKSVNFSDPYFVCEGKMAILKKYSEQGHLVVEKQAQEPFLKRLQQVFHRNVIEEQRYLMIWDGLKTSAIIALFAALLGTLLGGIICWMKMSRFSLLNIMANTYITLMRGTPVLVLLMIMYYVAFAGSGISAVTVSIFTFALNFAAYVSEMFRAAIGSIDRGQREAGIAMGFSSMKTFYYIIMPQAFRQVMPVYKGELISLVKMTSIVGYIAVQDLTKVGDIIRSRTFDAFFPLIMVAVLYFLLAWLFSLVIDLIAKPTKKA